ncbi:hypothetical protein ABE545_12405 [Sphingobacterium faecium]|uniref:hypothetical protein n=1 Tax=Sphingobacterium faecium TaxID=34087 RepID=UPI003208A863
MTTKNLTTTGTSSYKPSYGGAVYLTFGESQIMLTTADITIPKFAYVSESFYTAVSLGQLNVALNTILTKFSDVSGVDVTSVTDKIKSLSNLPILKQILTAELVITEFVVQPPTTAAAKDDLYSFGMGLRLTQDNKLGPITLDGVAFNIKLTQIQTP